MESQVATKMESEMNTSMESEGGRNMDSEIVIEGSMESQVITNMEQEIATDVNPQVETNVDDQAEVSKEGETEMSMQDNEDGASQYTPTDGVTSSIGNEDPQGREAIERDHPVEIDDTNDEMLASGISIPVTILDEEEERYLCEEDDSECTDDEENQARSSETEMEGGEAMGTEATEGQIAIFEYNEDGLMRKSHLSLEEKDLIKGEKEDVESSGDEGEIFQCRKCQKVCTTWASYRSHLKSHSNQNAFSCALCQKTFQTKHFVERHVRTFHKKERPYICRFCGKGFSTEWYCQKHESHHEKGTGPRIAARDRTYSCTYCRKVFTKPRQLRMHESTHTGEKKYCCTVCDKSFCYSSSLFKHLKCMHSDKSTSVCQFCNKVYSTEESLLKHNQYHIGIDQFKCRKCGEVFRDMLTLKRHGRNAHFNEVDRPYQCTDCGKCFTHKSVLEVHSRCHTGERPYLCTCCDKSFRQKSQLKTHMRSHSLERPYVCGTCGKSYAECGSLQRHERTHTGEKPFSCSVCQKSFAVSHVLARHMKTHAMPTNQDAEILALALKSFVQSMEKMKETKQSNEMSEASTGGIATEVQIEGGSKSAQDLLPLIGVSKAEVATTSAVATQVLSTTKLQTAQGPIEILSFAIEDEIHPIATTSEDASGIPTEGKMDEETRMVAKEIAVQMEVANDLSESQSLDPTKPEYSFQVNVDDDFISPSIYENPNMEKIRQRYNRKPQMVERETLNPGHDDEARNALVELSVGADVNTSTAADPKDATQAAAVEIQEVGGHQDPADESEATDDEMEEEANTERGEEEEESKGNEEKVFESLSIFEIFGSSLVCVQKVDMFEPKFHKKCHKCNKNFFSHGGYENHMKRHEIGKEMRYMCQYCGRNFTAKLSLKAHEAIHTGETLYKCQYCPREFRNYSSHRIHTATHTGLKPYPCQYCNKPFAQLAHVQRHERTHTGSKPYACEFCDKAFAEWGTWQRHTRTHTGEKPYVCPTCGKGFIVKFALRRHLKTHRNDSGDTNQDKTVINIVPKVSEGSATTTSMQEDIIVADPGPDETEVSTEQLQTTMEEEVVQIDTL